MTRGSGGPPRSRSALAPALALGLAACVPRPAWTPPPKHVAFVGVHVIPMDRERVLDDHTVLVRDGRIVALGPADEVDVPEDAIRVEPGEGWLIPGLCDSHVHLLSDERIDPRFAERELDVLLANGVTTARLAIGKPHHLELRARVRAGEKVGPSLFVTSPQIAGRSVGPDFEGRVVSSPEEAAPTVRALAAGGYDALQLGYWIRPEVHAALAAAAAEVGLPLVGQVGPEVGLERALEVGQQIEHVDQYLEALLPPGSPLEASVSGLGVWEPARWAQLDALDTARIPGLAEAVARAGVRTTPTLSFLETSFGTGRSDEEIAATPDAEFVSDEVREELLRVRDAFWAEPPPAEQRARYVILLQEITRALHQSGAPLLAGSEAPEGVLFCGFSLHRELECLVAAGLPPWAALATATRSPAEWMGRLEEAGTIEVGKRADLVLLRRDPLEDVRATRAIEGVLVQGRWLGRRKLDRLLEEAAAELSRAPLREPPAGAGE